MKSRGKEDDDVGEDVGVSETCFSVLQSITSSSCRKDATTPNTSLHGGLGWFFPPDRFLRSSFLLNKWNTVMLKYSFFKHTLDFSMHVAQGSQVMKMLHNIIHYFMQYKSFLNVSHIFSLYRSSATWFLLTDFQH